MDKIKRVDDLHPEEKELLFKYVDHLEKKLMATSNNFRTDYRKKLEISLIDEVCMISTTHLLVATLINIALRHDIPQDTILQKLFYNIKDQFDELYPILKNQNKKREERLND